MCIQYKITKTQRVYPQSFKNVVGDKRFSKIDAIGYTLSARDEKSKCPK